MPQNRNATPNFKIYFNKTRVSRGCFLKVRKTGKSLMDKFCKNPRPNEMNSFIRAGFASAFQGMEGKSEALRQGLIGRQSYAVVRFNGERQNERVQAN